MFRLTAPEGILLNAIFCSSLTVSALSARSPLPLSRKMRIRPTSKAPCPIVTECSLTSSGCKPATICASSCHKWWMTSTSKRWRRIEVLAGQLPRLDVTEMTYWSGSFLAMLEREKGRVEQNLVNGRRSVTAMPSAKACRTPALASTTKF